MKHRIPKYILTNLDRTEEIDGGFRSHELIPVSPKTKFSVRKIVRRNNKKGESKIVFNDLSDDVYEWIKTDEITEHMNAGNPKKFQPLLKYTQEYD